MANLRLDLHVHTIHSRDSRLTVEDALQRAMTEGLSGIAITDHNSTRALAPARAFLEGNRTFLLVPGVEVTTASGHLLVYGMDREPPPHRPMEETLDAVREAGGVPVLAHPFRWVHGAGRRAAERLPVAGIEAMNGRNAELPNARAGLVAASRHLSATGGSDAHEVISIGRCYSEVSEEVASVEDFLEHLRRGRVQAGGRSRSNAERVWLSLVNAGRRARRGFRGV